MESWWQCEIPYPFVPQEVLAAADSVRGSLPNKWCDPKISADLFEEVLDEFLLCDDEGMNVLAIEHHAGINSLMGCQSDVRRHPGAADAQGAHPEPRHAGVAAQGSGAHRRGIRDRRRDVARPAGDRLREIGRHRDGVEPDQPGRQPGTLLGSDRPDPQGAVHHDGPFSWEGKYFTHRHVNIWPRPWQQPHPRLWSATGDPPTAAEVGRRGMVHVLVLRGPDGTKRAYQAHRRARAEAGLPKVTTDNFAYAAMVYVGETEEEGRAVGSKLLWFLNTSLKSAPQYSKFLPGAAPPEFAPQVYRTAPRPCRWRRRTW